MKTVIVVFGNKGMGKDTFADSLPEEITNHIFSNSRLRLRSDRFAFAEPVKIIGFYLLGIPIGLPYEQKETYMVYGKTAREWWQWIGTELGREMIHKDIWVHRLGDKVINSNKDVFIVSDGRFNNERTELAQYLHDKDPEIKYDVVNVKIIRDGFEVNLNHKSESEVYEMKSMVFDFNISNNKTIEDLQKKAKETIMDLLVTNKDIERLAVQR